MIPFLDLNAQNRALLPEIEAALREVVASSEFCLGSHVERFEQGFARFCGARHAIGVSSGTSALHMALLALDIGPGDEVITVASTFVATVAAIRYCGATPVLVDIEPGRCTMDPGLVEAAITPRTAALLPVHLYGRMADMDPIRSIAERRGLALIEDAAQAHGADYKGRSAGTIGNVGCFSFYPGKVIGAFGEGGAIVTDDDALAGRVRAMRDWGQRERAVHQWPCFNYRMDGLQGAVLGLKLPHAASWVGARGRVAATYERLLAERVPVELMRRPEPANDGRHAWHQYAVRVAERDRVRAALTKAGIQTGIHYPLPVHLQPGFADLGWKAGDLPQSEALAGTTLSLPIYPELTDAQLDTVVGTLADELVSMAGRGREPSAGT
jgi:dTDP-4-amino-4,6-dideoxygalactose transaminase